MNNKKIPDINNPNIYTEDTLAHDWNFNWGLTTNSIVTAHTDVTIDTERSSEGFQVEERNTLEGEVRTVKSTRIMLIASAALAIVFVAGVVIGGISIGELILQGAG